MKEFLLLLGDVGNGVVVDESQRGEGPCICHYTCNKGDFGHTVFGSFNEAP